MQSAVCSVHFRVDGIQYMEISRCEWLNVLSSVTTSPCCVLDKPETTRVLVEPQLMVSACLNTGYSGHNRIVNIINFGFVVLCAHPLSCAQILPQLLSHLHLDIADAQSVDWATLVVYTCSKSCTTQDGYQAEFVWKQDF